MKNLEKGFTLAETLITLTILGVVAAITVPSLINKYSESANRTKLKKAMAAYEKALNQMIIDNDIKGDIGDAINKAGCTIATEYFKKIQGSGCYFQTSDKIWWGIEDIEHPVISLKDQITSKAESDAIKAKADSLDDDKTSFVMVGEIKNSIVRINDKVAVSSTDEDYLDKLYAFINLIYNANNLENKYCNCSGQDCCSSNCLNELCVEKNLSCQLSNDINCKRSVWYNKDRTSYQFIEELNGIYTMRHDITVKVNSDGNLSVRRETPGSGANLNEIVYNKQGEVIAYYNYDRGWCYKDSCSWDYSPFADGKSHNSYDTLVKANGSVCWYGGNGCFWSFGEEPSELDAAVEHIVDIYKNEK